MRLILGLINACYHLVQYLLSSCPMAENVKSKICISIILPIILYGSETWSLASKERIQTEGS
jgi:hypothetical protein